VVAGDFFGIGTTEDLFHSSGTRPVRRDRFRRLVTEGVMLLAVDLSIMADIPSGPVALEVSRQDRKKWTSSSVHSRSSGMVWSALKIEVLGKRGGTARLKDVEKKSLNISAFSLSE